MLKRFDLPSCPVELTLMLCGDRTKFLIVRDLLTGTKRFGELQKSIGTSQKVLTQHLRIMEEYNLITREVFAEIPPKVEYTLTALGTRLKPIIDTMYQWGESYKTNAK